MLTLAPLLLAALSVPQDRPPAPGPAGARLGHPQHRGARHARARHRWPRRRRGVAPRARHHGIPGIPARPGKAPTCAPGPKVAYDDRNLYVFVRAFDPDPATVTRLLARRDGWPPGDHIVVVVDSYHDRRTGFRVRCLSIGGTLRRRPHERRRRGQRLGRRLGRRDHRGLPRLDGGVSHPPLPAPLRRCARTHLRARHRARHRPNQRAGELARAPPRPAGDHLAARRPQRHRGHLPLRGASRCAAYVVTEERHAPRVTHRLRPRQHASRAAPDVKYGVASNLTLDATGEPRLGQVEADPAVLNLGAFETFYQEKRPFFIEGNGLLRFSVNCNSINCSSEGALLLAAHRARPTARPGQFGDARVAHSTRILGAASSRGGSPAAPLHQACSTPSPSVRTARRTAPSSRRRTTHW